VVLLVGSYTYKNISFILQKTIWWYFVQVRYCDLAVVYNQDAMVIEAAVSAAKLSNSDVVTPSYKPSLLVLLLNGIY
jgi:hypothetical protein